MYLAVSHGQRIYGARVLRGHVDPESHAPPLGAEGRSYAPVQDLLIVEEAEGPHIVIVGKGESEFIGPAPAGTPPENGSPFAPQIPKPGGSGRGGPLFDRIEKVPVGEQEILVQSLQGIPGKYLFECLPKDLPEMNIDGTHGPVVADVGIKMKSRI